MLCHFLWLECRHNVATLERKDREIRPHQVLRYIHRLCGCITSVCCIPAMGMVHICLTRIKSTISAKQRSQHSGFNPGRSTLDRAIALRLLAERRHEHHQLMCAAYFVYTPKTCRYRQNLLLLHQQRGQSDWVILHLARYPSGFCSCSRFFNYRYWPTEQSQKNWVSMSTGPRSSFSPSAHVCPLNHPYSHGITSILFLDCPLQ